MEKNEKKIGLLTFPNIITEQRGYDLFQLNRQIIHQNDEISIEMNNNLCSQSPLHSHHFCLTRCPPKTTDHSAILRYFAWIRMLFIL